MSKPVTWSDRGELLRPLKDNKVVAVEGPSKVRPQSKRKSVAALEKGSKNLTFMHVYSGTAFLS